MLSVAVKEKKKSKHATARYKPQSASVSAPTTSTSAYLGKHESGVRDGHWAHFNAAPAEAGHFCYSRRARLDGSLDAVVRKEARLPLLWGWINRSLSARWHRCAERSPRWQLQASNHIQGSCFGALELLKENGQKLSFFALVLYRFTLENLS